LRSNEHIIYISGERTPFRNDTDRELPFRQESNFVYLTGCHVPASAALLSFTPSTNKLVTKLFIPAEDPLETMWSIPPPTLEAASRTHDADGVFYTSTLAQVLANLPSPNRALLHVLPSVKTLPTHLEPLSAGQASDEYLFNALAQARLIKSDAEIDLMRTASAISSRAHEVIMRLLGKGVRTPPSTTKKTGLVMPEDWLIEKESEAEAVFVATCRREGAVHQAYLPIVAASQRAATLHYCCNSSDFAWGPTLPALPDASITHKQGHQGHQILPQVLLIDAACEWDCYASDITRTMPVGNGGKFTSEGGAIYDLVLEMQTAAYGLVRPGTHWDSAQHACHVTLVRGFLKLGIFKGSEQELLDSDVTTAFFPHGLGHSIGMDVHDVPSCGYPWPPAWLWYAHLSFRGISTLTTRQTVEPGIYFSPHLLAPVRKSQLIDHEVLARYEPVGGVRIEDVVLVTQTGYEILSPVGKDRAWVEKVCSGES
ncbi:Creatinase/aminopeptidase, partial [Auriculariales sp. MPI-PUGE-AT-0066]